MAAARVHKLSFFSLGKLSLMNWVLVRFSLGSTIVSANIISGLHVFNQRRGKRKEGDCLTGFSSLPSS
jgi:hypothetical protein